MASFSIPGFASLALGLASCALGLPQEPPDPSVSSIRFRQADRCGELQFRARVASGPAEPLAELVVAVNGEVCHREGVPGGSTVYGVLADLCPDAGLFEPGPNLVEVILVSAACGRPALARRMARCEGPEAE